MKKLKALLQVFAPSTVLILALTRYLRGYWAFGGEGLLLLLMWAYFVWRVVDTIHTLENTKRVCKLKIQDLEKQKKETAKKYAISLASKDIYIQTLRATIVKLNDEQISQEKCS